jgi:hypothetical protein
MWHSRGRFSAVASRRGAPFSTTFVRVVRRPGATQHTTKLDNLSNFVAWPTLTFCRLYFGKFHGTDEINTEIPAIITVKKWPKRPKTVKNGQKRSKTVSFTKVDIGWMKQGLVSATRFLTKKRSKLHYSTLKC